MQRPYFDIVASGARMREIRKSRNISVTEVMEYMQFESTQAVYKWESGKCLPQADNLIALAMFYDVNPKELLVEAGEASYFFARVLYFGQRMLYYVSMDGTTIG